MSEGAPEIHELSRTLGLVHIVEMDPAGRAQIEYRAGMHMCHSGGVVQGGFVSGWIDAAMAHAAIAMGGPDVSPMTLELKVSYFAPARPGLVIAEGWVERRGRSTCFFEGRLLDEHSACCHEGRDRDPPRPAELAELAARPELAPRLVTDAAIVHHHGLYLAVV